MTTTETPPTDSLRTENRFTVPWILFGVCLVGMLVFARLYFNKPNTSVSENVERVVTNTIVKPITNTVVDYVTNEVPKEIEKIVKVPEPIPDIYVFAMNTFTNMAKASLVNLDQILFNMEDVKIEYLLSDAIKRVVSEDEVKAKFELVLRRNNVPINPQSANTLYFGIDGFFGDGVMKDLLCHSFRCRVIERQWVVRGTNWHTANLTVWENGGYYGNVGRQNANAELLKTAEKCAELFANDYLSANPKPK